ncbi:MAG: putative DNA binding domain-containing protein [Bacteroidetes bacterium]|nr:putative DNA binding domain-containing protein [Bacteroidota bacterium]
MNASGVNLTDAELALAQITGYWPEARKLFKEKMEKLSSQGFVFNLDFIIYALLGIMYNMGSDMRKLHNTENRELIKNVWKSLDNVVLDYVINILKSQAYVDHTKEINSVYALISIIVYVYNKPNNKLTQEEINKVIKWFYYSQIRQRYVSQLPQKLDVDIKTVVNSENPFDELLNIIKVERPLEISKDEFVGATVQNALFNLMKFYFKSKNAICLGTGISLSKNMGNRYELENDHIFAWSILRENGYNMNNRQKYALAQEITNRAILTSTENRRKSAEVAEVYLREVKINFPNALKLQIIPEDPNLWKIENYELFLEERRKLLVKELNEFLNNITETSEGDDYMSYEEIVAAGEDEFHEFKATLRWDVRESRVNKSLEEVILKTIASFNNKEGGMLIIGASDDGELIGLDDDYNCLKDGDKDKYELHLRNLFNEAYGKEYTANNLIINFPKLDDIEICVIEIAKGTNPLYTTITDSNGQKKEKFYIRSGNSSPELTNLSEITSYIKNHFG